MEPKTYLVALHLIGLVIGLGSVTALDFYLIRFVKGTRVSPSDADLVHLVSRLAASGLLCLWVSGLGFLILYRLNAPELLGNPKIHAKLIIVGVLTLNGVLLHFKLLPQIRRAVGHTLFGAGTLLGSNAWVRICAPVSVASWWMPFVLGAVRELNFAAPIWVFLAAYIAALAVCGIGFAAIETRLLGRKSDPVLRASPPPQVGHSLAAATPDQQPQ